MDKNYWVVYVAFFGLIAFAVYWTHSLVPLFALLLTPTYESKNNDKNDEKE
jgi:hypothetical protein